MNAIGRAIRARGVLRHGLGLVCAVLALAAPATHAQESLKFFKNYFVSGDYVAAGVALEGKGVNGIATGAITVPGSEIPANAEIVAAYLYWQTISSSGSPAPSALAGAKFKGNDISGNAVLLSTTGTAPCSSGGGGTGSSNGSRATWAYRADVLRYFPRRRPSDPSQPVQVEVSGAHEVRLPDAGGSNSLPKTLGAGLVVVYRVAGYSAASGYTTPLKPLRSIVLYDGGAVMDNATRQFAVSIEGFYEASRAAPNARMTHMVANGQSNKTERVQIRSTTSASDNILVATNPFAGNAGFDVVTFGNLALEKGAMKATVTVDPGTNGSFDCLNWVAVVLSSEVQDRDGDGLLDVWEARSEWSSKPARLGSQVYPSWPLPVPEPGAGTLPNLEQMGASPAVQDVFVQLDYMTGAGHTHLPSRTALRSVATAFRNAAPRPYLVAQGLCAANAARGQCPINIHFDVGANYQPPAFCATWTPDCAFVPAALAKGGKAIPEQTCIDTPSTPQCAFPGVPGVVRWKTGYRRVRDQLVDQNGNPDDVNGQPRFARNRKDIFRYGLFAHALGIPSLSNAQVPRKTSGIADGGGGADFMVTLGLWDNQTGTDFIQGATLMHELGHTFGLRHGGIVASSQGLEPNCKPNYQSVMNYLFQVRGLLTSQGNPAIDFSRQQLPEIVENALSEQLGFSSSAALDYLPRWYAPQSGSFIDRALSTAPATRLCDGSPVSSGTVAHVRVDADPRRGTAIDWNADGAIAPGSLPEQDVNFDGDGPQPQRLAGASDFDTMDLRQTGARRAVGSKSVRESVTDGDGVAVGGGLSLDSGYADLGYADLGYADLGYADLGYADLGAGDLGYADLGYGEFGYGEAGVPTDAADLYSGGDVDLDTAGSLANAPSALTALALKGNGGIQLQWVAPHVGSALSYDVYRVVGPSVTPANIAARVLVANVVGFEFVIDTNSLKRNETYTYFVVANLPRTAECTPAAGSTTCRSGVSNYATINY